MVAPGASAWDRRDDESVASHARFMEYLRTPRSERGALIRKRGNDREWYRRHEWPVRAAAYDDQVDRDYEQARLEHAREVREFHAKAGRALLSYAIGQIREKDWKPSELVKLADLARRMEMMAVFGSEREMEATAHAAVSAAGADVDEWDRLAAEMEATLPPPPTHR